MNILSATLEGARAREIPKRFAEAIPERSWLTRPILGEGAVATSSFGDVHIVYYERYFARTRSDLLLVVVFAFRDSGFCTVEIVSGGGKAGSIPVDMGAEYAMAETAIQTLEKLSAELSLVCKTQR